MTLRHARQLRIPLAAGALLLSGTACAPFSPRIKDGALVDSGSKAAAFNGLAATVTVESERAKSRAAMDSLYSAAVTACEPRVCDALARGELLLGMSEAQLLAATKSTPAAWDVRRSGPAMVMVPAARSSAPHDVTGDVALAQFSGGRVAVIVYRDTPRAPALRVVSAAFGADARARNAETAAALVHEGDAFAAASDLRAALNRYDRASVLVPDNPDVQYKTARILDLQLRPGEALVRYRQFLQLVGAGSSGARGSAVSARMAEAIAAARERVAALEKGGR